MQKIRIEPDTTTTAQQWQDALSAMRNVEFLWHTTRVLIDAAGCVYAREIGADVWVAWDLSELCETLVRGE